MKVDAFREPYFAIASNKDPAVRCGMLVRTGAAHPNGGVHGIILYPTFKEPRAAFNGETVVLRDGRELAAAIAWRGYIPLECETVEAKREWVEARMRKDKL